MFQNANINGARPLTYSFDVATDSAFKNIVFARTRCRARARRLRPRSSCPTSSRLAPTGGGRAPRTVPTPVPIRRTKSFQVLAEVVLSPPMPSSPSNGSTLSDLTPEFRVKGGQPQRRHLPTSSTSLQVSNNSSFTSIAAMFTHEGTLARDDDRQRLLVPHGRTYYWRVRACTRLTARK